MITAGWYQPCHVPLLDGSCRVSGLSVENLCLAVQIQIELSNMPTDCKVLNLNPAAFHCLEASKSHRLLAVSIQSRGCIDASRI
jgi:hypothetical protein